MASAPNGFGERAAELAEALVAGAGALSQSADEAVEIDVTCEDGVVFVVREPDRAMVCVTERTVLAGLIFHDMHAVLHDLERAAGQGDLRAAAGIVQEGGTS